MNLDSIICDIYLIDNIEINNLTTKNLNRHTTEIKSEKMVNI